MSLAVPNQDNGNITRRLSTNIRPQSLQTAKLDDLIRHVGVHWKDLVSDNANTLEAALALMDTSSIGKARYQSKFDQLKQDLRDTLKYHVDANYQGFNSSIGSYRSVVQGITDSQMNVSNARDEITKARESLATRRPTLKDLRASSLKYNSMIDILDKIEELKAIPDKLEMQISQKQFLSANETLTHALRLADTKELQGITALHPIKSYLLSQQSSLFSILIEELHNHVYLKSPYCDSRWSAYTQENDNFSNVEHMLEDKIKFDLSEKGTTFSGSALLDEFLTNFDREQPMVEDPRKNIESDSFEYIRLIVETLANLSRLSQAFDSIHQRLPAELHKIVDKTIGEVSLRYPQSVRDLQDVSVTAGFLDNGYASSDVRLGVLKDLTWTLYSKFVAVLQGHRVIFEVVDSIAGRRGESENLFTYDFNGVFRIIQSEIRSLLHSYITDKSHTAAAQTRDMHDLMKVPFNGTRKPRDKKKSLFKLEQVDFGDTEFQNEYSELQSTLENSVPGLVSSAYSDKDNKLTPYAPTDLSSAHRLLVAPNVFNIRVMLDPTVMFLQKVKAVFPFRNADDKVSDAFIEEFLINVFLPQLEDSLSLSFHKIMSNADNMQIDLQWSKFSKRPIFKGATAFVNLVQKTCRLLNTGYLYREKYAALVISLIQWLLKYFTDQYESMIVLQDESNKTRRIPAALALESEMKELCLAIMDDESNVSYARKETKLLLAKRKSGTAGDEGLLKSDLVDVSSYKTLAILTTSLRWIVLKLKALRQVSEPEVDEKNATNLDTKLKKRWTLMEVNRAAQVDSSERNSESLVLQGESLNVFDAAVEKLEDLANLCVMTLRCDVRTRIVMHVDRSMTEGDYFSDIESEERDGQIAALDDDLIKTDEMVSDYLLLQDKQLILGGLAAFIDEVLIYGADRLNYLNMNGVKKMQCNIVVLQQMLKAIMVKPVEVDFKRSTNFYKSFMSNPNVFMNSVKQGELDLSLEEARILVRLMHYEAIRKFESSNRRDAANQARTELSNHLQQLRQLYTNGK